MYFHEPRVTTETISTGQKVFVFSVMCLPDEEDEDIEAYLDSQSGSQETIGAMQHVLTMLEMALTGKREPHEANPENPALERDPKPTYSHRGNDTGYRTGSGVG